MIAGTRDKARVSLRGGSACGTPAVLPAGMSADTVHSHGDADLNTVRCKNEVAIKKVIKLNNRNEW